MSKRSLKHIYFISAIVLGYFNQPLRSLYLESKFTFTNKCIDPSCVHENFGKKGSSLKCASLCGKSEDCAAYQYFPNDTKCVSLYRGCLTTAVCTRSKAELRVFEKRFLSPLCYHGGTWLDVQQMCKCVDFWVGQFCERRPYSCGDLHRYWYSASAYFNVPIDVFKNGSRIISTVCFLYSNRSITYIFANTGKPDPGSTWQTYTDGYFINYMNYWFGLENILAFNKVGHTNVGLFLALDANPGPWASWENLYTGFHMEDATNGYKFTCDQPTRYSDGDLRMGYEMADLLSMSQNVPFSTPDWDRDNDADHCANKAGRGWWFNTCNPIKNMNTSINPLGRNYKDHPGPPSDRHIWIPGVDMTDPAVQNTFEVVAIYFYDPNPLRL